MTREVVGDTIVEHKGCQWMGPALCQAEIAAAYINGIDPKYAGDPTVKGEIELYARMAGVRGRAKDILVADSGVYNVRPSQDNKYRVDADKKQLNIGARDEAAVKTKIGDMIKNIDAGHPANYKPEPVVPMPGSH